MKIPRTDVQCEVLIIGGGLAALVAALEAKKLFDEVVIVSKSKIGRSGNTIVSQCRFAAHVPHDGSQDSAKQHFRDTLVGGSFINDETLVNALVSQAGQRLRDLERYGVRFLRTNGGFARQTAPGHSRPRTISALGSEHPHAVLGLSVTLPLLREAKARSTRLIEDASIVRSEDSLQRARSRVRECQRVLEHCAIQSFAQAVKWEELRRMCLAAEAIVAAALLRTESRGAHYRQDFPSSDED